MADTNEALKEMIVEAAQSIRKGEPLKMAKGISNEELNAVYSLAYSYYSTGRYEDALKLFKFLVLFDHMSQKYWTGLGSTHQMLKQYDEALAAYAQAAIFDLENPKPMYYAALCHYAKGDKVKAASAVRAIEMFCTKRDAQTLPFLEKAAALRAALGEEPFAELKKLDAEEDTKKNAAGA
jgi:type III secretion system low calcium response chaperone LcrH/SycD